MCRDPAAAGRWRGEALREIATRDRERAHEVACGRDLRGELREGRGRGDHGAKRGMVFERVRRLVVLHAATRSTSQASARGDEGQDVARISVREADATS